MLATRLIGIRARVSLCCLLAVLWTGTATRTLDAAESATGGSMNLAFENQTLDGWTADKADVWTLSRNPSLFTAPGNLQRFVADSYAKGEAKIEPLSFPVGFKAAKVTFAGGREADMLNNIWVANLVQMSEKFDKETGLFRETGKDTPWYGGYLGFGTWLPIGVIYQWACSRSAEECAVVPLRCIDEPERASSFVDFCDKWLTGPRKEVYGKSRWDSTKDAAEFICWMMDYTGGDVMYGEGEGNGWCSFLSGFPAIPKGWANETDPAKIRWNYANADVYEAFATYACLTGLRRWPMRPEMAHRVRDGGTTPTACRPVCFGNSDAATIRRSPGGGVPTASTPACRSRWCRRGSRSTSMAWTPTSSTTP